MTRSGLFSCYTSTWSFWQAIPAPPFLHRTQARMPVLLNLCFFARCDGFESRANRSLTVAALFAACRSVLLSRQHIVIGIYQDALRLLGNRQLQVVKAAAPDHTHP